MELKEIYEAYIQKSARVTADAPALAGVWGMGEDPKNHPCHIEFYEAVEAFLTDFLSQPHPEEILYEAAGWIIRTPAAYKDQAVFWYMFAAHGLCKPLIPLLTPAHCAELREFYDDNYPKFDRMPVQRDLYKLLKKRAKA